MLLSDIFNIGLKHEGKVRDFKFKQCEHIDSIEEAPFIKRCTKSKAIGLRVCRSHAFTVTFDHVGIGERTNYFDTQYEAEYFRTREVPSTWTETNYKV
jgi:hypothetical protein